MRPSDVNTNEVHCHGAYLAITRQAEEDVNAERMAVY